MNIKKQLISFGAAVAATVAMVSPASATIYTYTVNDDEVFKIDTVAKTGSFQGSVLTRDSNVIFSSESFASFTGGLNPTFTGILNSISGYYMVNGNSRFDLVNGNLANLGAGVPRLIFSNGAVGLFGTVWRNANGATFGDNNWSITGVTSEPSPVPEPAMLGLFGAGAVMVMMGRRRRSVAKSVAGAGKLALAC